MQVSCKNAFNTQRYLVTYATFGTCTLYIVISVVSVLLWLLMILDACRFLPNG